MFSWIRDQRRQQLLEQPLPREWKDALDARVRHWKYLDDEKRRRIEGFTRVLLAEKDWAGGSGFELTDEMRVTISGYAGVMTLGMVEPYYFDRLKTIIVYPGTYLPAQPLRSVLKRYVFDCSAWRSLALRPHCAFLGRNRGTEAQSPRKQFGLSRICTPYRWPRRWRGWHSANCGPQEDPSVV